MKNKSTTPYKIVSQESWSLGVEKAIKLDWNESDYELPQSVKRRLISFIESKPLNWYPELNKKIIYQLLSQYSKVSQEFVQYFDGSDGFHEIVVRSLTEINDRVVVASPAYDNFRLVCELEGLIVNKVQIYSEQGLINLDLLYDQILKTKPKLVYIVNPNNPTGLIISNKDLISFLKKFPETYFLIDEAYFEYANQSIASHTKNYTNLIVSRTMSKAFGLAGFRFGYCISNPININVFNLYRNPKSINSLALEAVEAIFMEKQLIRNNINNTINERESFYNFIEKINKIEALPNSKANFILLKFSNSDSKNWFNKELQSEGFFLRNFDSIFETDCYLRISIGSKNSMDRLKNTISKII